MQEPGAAQPASFGHGSAQHGFDVGAYAAPAAAGAADPHAWVDPLAQPQQPQPGLDTHQPAQGGYQGQDFLQSNEQQSQAQQTADAFQSPSYDPSAGYQQQNSNTYADPALDPYGYQPPEMAPDHGGLESVSQSHELDGQYGEDYDDEMYDEPPRGRRSLVVVGALVGAIAVGGGLAYGYKSILGSGPASQTAKVVRSNSAPAKVKPSDPGGKKFAHSDSKVLGRLGDKTGSSTTSSSGTRKVSTLSIGRDGVIRGGAAAGATAAGATGPAQAAADDTDTGAAEISAPGISVVDAFAGRPPAADSAAVKKQASKATSSAAKPIIIAETRPTTVAPSKKATPKPAQLGGSSVAPSAGTKVAARKPAPKPATSSGGATRNGYVVVLASVPVSSTSRVKALTQYANIQQKYGTVLSGKTPDVVEANLGAKGTYHRLLVGPPGSRTSASRLCSSLKAAGYSGCWVTAY